MPSIIQFMHPGSEQGPDKGKVDYRSWNVGNHKRKFIQAKGDYVINHDTVLLDQELEFWGEWEPPSHVKKMGKLSTIKPSEEKLYPEWLHQPFLPKECPINYLQITDCERKNTGCSVSTVPPEHQNTDPCVFGKTFKYFVCKQLKNHNKQGEDPKSTSLAELDTGSLILFGSKTTYNEQAVFQLDTVFVVADCINYNPSKENELLKKGLSQIYVDYIYNMAFPMPDKKCNLDLKIYRGATFENSVDGMYSFSPVKPYQQSVSGFPRVILDNIDKRFLNTKLSQGFKKNEIDKEEMLKIWKQVRSATLEQGCYEGISFSYPEKE